jgi:hypothetical protein
MWGMVRLNAAMRGLFSIMDIFATYELYVVYLQGNLGSRLDDCSLLHGYVFGGRECGVGYGYGAAALTSGRKHGIGGSGWRILVNSQGKSNGALIGED